jgi:2-octaprenyl-6-methoxyphenol hydroxylase
MKDERCDIAVCGGGLVGASLAIALAQLQLDVVLIEAARPGAPGQPSFDDRTTALSNGSRRIFEQLGVWSLIEREATPIRRIHISDQGRFGFARIDAAEQKLAALGFVVVNRGLGAALWRRLEEAQVRVLAPARIEQMQAIAGARVIDCDLGDDVRTRVTARLAIAADGAKSAVREAAGVSATTWDYDSVALTTNVFSQRFHDHVAYERFTPAGPIALLPMSEGRVGLVWTVAPALAAKLAALPDPEFLMRLQDAFGFRLGRFTRVGVRQQYPLSLTRSADHIAERMAVVGNAAQALHPIAGQGFNLGLRDAASLAEVLADGLAASGAEFDPGDGLTLERYREWRQADRGRIVGFTDGLVRLFTQPFGPAKTLRDLGLLAFDLLPAAKDAMSQLSLGAAGRIPKLARGTGLGNPTLVTRP